MVNIVARKITHPQYRFIAEISLFEPGTTEPYFPSDELTDEILSWCKQAKLGRRVSYDMWTFRNEQEMMAFILRWNNVQI